MRKLLRSIHDNTDRIVFMFSAMCAGAVAIYIANLTVYRYGLIVRAYLGASVFYLAYMNFIKLSAPDGFRPSFPRDLKYLPFAFLLAMTLYWAGIQISDLIRFLLKEI